MPTLITNHPPNASSTRRGRFLAQVIGNYPLCTEHFRLTLSLKDFPLSLPGQFIQLSCNNDPEGTDPCPHIPHEIEWPSSTSNAQCPTSTDSLFSDPDFLTPRAYLRRPFSIAARRDLADSRTEIDIIHRVAGKGTHFLATLTPGTEISLLGPMGNGFWLPENMALALLVGGGVGIPPMFYLANELATQNKPAIAFLGAQRPDLVPLTFPPTAPAPSSQGDPILNATEFASLNIPTVLTTDDGSLGMKGFITAALKNYLAKSSLKGITVFCCGPTPMMRATAAVCEEVNVLCQLSLEQPMACGMGTCQSCVIKWKGPPKPSTPASTTQDWVYKLTCQEGPVFDSREILW